MLASFLHPIFPEIIRFLWVFFFCFRCTEDLTEHQQSLNISAQHHERYDGTGYPERLKGEEISKGGQMAAVVDVYDAISYNRVYKKAWKVEEVLAFIKKQKGHQFEPQLVDVFLTDFEQFEKIRKLYADE